MSLDHDQSVCACRGCRNIRTPRPIGWGSCAQERFAMPLHPDTHTPAADLGSDRWLAAHALMSDSSVPIRILALSNVCLYPFAYLIRTLSARLDGSR